MDAVRTNPGAYPSWVAPIAENLYAHAGRLAAAGHLDQVTRLHTLQDATEQYRAASETYHQAREHLAAQSSLPNHDTDAADKLPDLRHAAVTARERAERADQTVRTLTGDPAITSQPDPAAILEGARREWEWNRSREAAERKRQYVTQQRAAARRVEPHAPTIGSDGPSIGF